MTHIVRGVIADSQLLRSFAQVHSFNGPISLAGDLALLPLRDEDIQSFSVAPREPVHDFECLTAEFVEVLCALSRAGSVLYFETEYFGGAGSQGAAVFRDGSIAFGPESADIGPINKALAFLGVCVAPPARDQFETVGLHRHRTVEAWLKYGSLAAHQMELARG